MRTASAGAHDAHAGPHARESFSRTDKDSYLREDSRELLDQSSNGLDFFTAQQVLQTLDEFNMVQGSRSKRLEPKN